MFLKFSESLAPSNLKVHCVPGTLLDSDMALFLSEELTTKAFVTV